MDGGGKGGEEVSGVEMDEATVSIDQSINQSIIRSINDTIPYGLQPSFVCVCSRVSSLMTVKIVTWCT
jgi:hypothetical protein